MPFLSTVKANDLYQNTRLRDRVRLILYRCAAKFLQEPKETPFHDERVAYAQRALQGGDEEVRRVVLIGLATAQLDDSVAKLIEGSDSATLSDGKVPGLDTATLDTLFIALIEANWNTLAGVIANPSDPQPVSE